MRIFLVLHPTGNLAVPESMTWYHNLYEPLIDLGHDVLLFRLDSFASNNNLKFRTPPYREKLSTDLFTCFTDQNNRKPFDLFFSYLTALDVTADCLQRIRELGVPMMNFSCNNTHQFDLVEPIVRFYDFNLHSEKSAAEKFKKAGAMGHWFQMAANPKYYRPLGLNMKFDVSFVGMNYARRAGYINHLLSNEINVNCFGGGWVSPKGIPRLRKKAKKQLKILNLLVQTSPSKRYDSASFIRDFELAESMRLNFPENFSPPVTDEEMVQIFNQSKINLGFLEVYGSDRTGSTAIYQHLHLREFEVPMSGGLYFTNYSNELAEFFEPDKEVVIYRSEHELLDKVQYYLKNDSVAEKIRRAGYNRAIKEHTFQLRLKTMFCDLKLPD